MHIVFFRCVQLSQLDNAHSVQLCLLLKWKYEDKLMLSTLIYRINLFEALCLCSTHYAVQRQHYWHDMNNWAVKLIWHIKNKDWWHMHFVACILSRISKQIDMISMFMEPHICTFSSEIHGCAQKHTLISHCIHFFFLPK